jgi:peptidoglycan biosynthesis protein MviN/MurJ (putative lipid II flippase)
MFSSLGPNGIALATSLSTTATFILAIVILRSRLPALNLWSLIGSLAKVGLATAVMIGIMLGTDIFLSSRLHSIMSSPAVEALITLFAGGIIGTVVYAVGALVFRLEEMRAVMRVISRKVQLKT